MIGLFWSHFSADAYFVDLFVRVSNQVAITMYGKLGYIVYRRIIDYYSGENEEDAFGWGGLTELTDCLTNNLDIRLTDTQID